MSSSEEDSYSTIFTSLKHPIRRKILRVLSSEAQSFSDLQKQFMIESSHLTYHLDSLGNLLYKTEEGKYSLSSLGEAAVSMMKHVEEPPIASPLSFPLSHRTRILKTLTFLLVCGLVASLVFNALLLIKYTDSDKAYSILDKAYNGLDQAYKELNRSHGSLNQAYAELNNSNSRLENSYNTLNQAYQALLSNFQPHRVRNIETGAEYASVQEAINAAEDGNTILANAGVYYEHVTINKTLTLLGASKEDTIIDGSHNGDVVAITSDNVTLNGFTIRNSSNNLAAGVGIHLYNSKGSVVTGNVVTLNGFAGIEIENSDNNTFSDNIISSTIGSAVGLIWGDAIRLSSSANNTISDNIITNCTLFGIDLVGCQGNRISGNTILGQTIKTFSSANNTFFLNDFFAYPGPELIDGSLSNNSWSVRGEGNYWDDYVGLDDGSNGRVAGDGVGDTNLPWHGADNYPLISPVNPVQVFWDDQAFSTLLASNSTISTFTFDQTGKRITFNVTGPSNSKGYFNLSMPATLLSGPWEILVDGTDATSQAMVTENATQATIYLSYNQSSHNIQVIGTNVIPEYPNASTSLLALLMTLASLVLLVSTKGKNALRRSARHT